MTKKRVRPPETTFGDEWRIQYVQVRYPERVFKVYRRNTHIMSLPRSRFERGLPPSMFVLGTWTATRLKPNKLGEQLFAFQERCAAYDEYLDTDKGAGDTTFALKA